MDAADETDSVPRHDGIDRLPPPWTTGGGFRDAIAAERTFLAWIRTCLALLATGSAVSALPLLPERAIRIGIGLICVAASAPVAVTAYSRWHAAFSTAARRGRARPRRVALLLTSVVLLAAVVLGSAIGLKGAALRLPITPCKRAMCAARR